MSKQIQDDTFLTDEQQSGADLSAFIDAETSEHDTSQIIDKLLNDTEYKRQYIRRQLINDHLQEQVQSDINLSGLRSNISSALDELPAHYCEAAVNLQEVVTEDVTLKSQLKEFFIKALDNRVFSGVSVAASVMFVTLFTLQTINSPENNDLDVPLAHSQNNITNSTSNISAAIPALNTPSLINSKVTLPAALVSSNTESANRQNKEKYRWIEADPALSRQVRQYINEYERGHAGYNLQPQIRTATYQMNK
ncbi:MAG: hypothetical protein GY694_08580 [Gammaproteobacteria bacterium]|nr:hypothetical protein [Gammaproteobacteria bacterium]